MGLAQKGDDALRARWEIEVCVGIRLEQLAQRARWTHDRVERPTEMLLHRRLRSARDGEIGCAACAEDHVPAPEYGLDAREARALECTLELRHLRVRRHHAAQERDIRRLAHGVFTSTPASRRHASSSRSARSAISSRLRRLSRTRSWRSSTSPKFAFIGWKCAASASRRYRYSAPSIVVGGGMTGSLPPSMRDRLIPAMSPVALLSV